MTRQVEPGNSSAASSGLMVGRGKKKEETEGLKKVRGNRPSAKSTEKSIGPVFLEVEQVVKPLT